MDGQQALSIVHGSDILPALGAALRESSVIFAALLGAILLKERIGRWRIAGAMLVALGAPSIRWG